MAGHVLMPLKVTVKVDPAKVRAALTGSSGPVMRNLLVRGERVRQGARRQVGVHKPDPWGRPTNRRPGTLRESILVRPEMRGSGPVVVIGSNDPIALWHHEGTAPHPITPTKAPRLVFFPRGSATAVYALRVDHPGTKPVRYLTDNLRLAR